VRLGYDTALFRGPLLAPGWTDGLVSSGNVTPIVALEVDQGRLTARGAPQDSDDPLNYSARTMNPAGMAASAFAALLGKDGIKISGSPAQTIAGKDAATIASVSSPPLADIVEQMLQESNNVIAATLAGFVTDKAGSVLVFAIMAPDIPGDGQLQTTANAIDATAAGLAGCGCG
jgi:D-alanyl-D-alanine carboxypeptidase/D-alanyl-D-alanine-endopeptidase (penicillin-binding protein 4)